MVGAELFSGATMAVEVIEGGVVVGEALAGEEGAGPESGDWTTRNHSTFCIANRAFSSKHTLIREAKRESA